MHAKQKQIRGNVTGDIVNIGHKWKNMHVSSSCSFVLSSPVWWQSEYSDILF